MRPFRATYHNAYYLNEPKGNLEVLVIKILPPPTKEMESEAVFVFPDGRLGQDEISRFTNCRILWPDD